MMIFVLAVICAALLTATATLIARDGDTSTSADTQPTTVDPAPPVRLAIEAPKRYIGRHWADTVCEAPAWYTPLFNRELGRLLGGDARWQVTA